MGFGWFILPVFCGAYVELQTDHLQVISAIRQLRIYCAGVWHNFASSLLAVGLWWSLPYLYLLFYTKDSGAVVSEIFKVCCIILILHKHTHISHPFQVSLPTSQTLSHKSSFIPRTCNLWNVLPSSCFPESYICFFVVLLKVICDMVMLFGVA